MALHRLLLVALLGTSTSLSLRPVKDVLQRLEFDANLEADRFSFFYREAQEPLRRGAAFDDVNDVVNGTERRLALALPQHRIGFFTYGDRLVWHRERRIDRVFGSGRTPDTKIGDVVAGYGAWQERRRDAARDVIESARARLAKREFDEIRAATRAAQLLEITPAAWVDEAEALLGLKIMTSFIINLPDVALREGIADALEARGAPLSPRLWIDVF